MGHNLMTETHVIILAIALMLAVSTIFHTLRATYFDASVYAAFSFAVIWQILAYIETGYLDPLIIISSIMTTLASLAVALIVGLPFLAYRRRERDKRGHS